jgi:hypothetical protein
MQASRHALHPHDQLPVAQSVAMTRVRGRGKRKLEWMACGPAAQEIRHRQMVYFVKKIYASDRISHL